MKSLVRLLRRALLISFFCATLHAQEISIQALVSPSTVITKDGSPVNFALHGFIEFRSLSELFPYIDSQTHRWPGNPRLRRRQAATTRPPNNRFRRGIESLRQFSCTLMSVQSRNAHHAYRRRTPPRTRPSHRTHSGWIRRGLRRRPAKMETRYQLLERRSLHSRTCPLQLVPDRRGHPAFPWCHL